MAKSLRSKIKRKHRAVKRVRYGQKEAAKLEAMVKANEERLLSQENEENTGIRFVDLKLSSPNTASTKNEDETMELDGPKRSLKTLRDEHGTYPVWMNRRKIAKAKKAEKRKKSQKKRK